MARSIEVHFRTSLDLFLLDHWATYLSHMCVLDTQPKWNTHWAAEVLRLQLHSWKQTRRLTKTGWLSPLKRYSGNYSVDISQLLFYFFLNSLEASLMCLFLCLAAVTTVVWQRAAVSHCRIHTRSVLVSDQSHTPNTSNELKLITLYLICPI